jgi:hypothetical protein
MSVSFRLPGARGWAGTTNAGLCTALADAHPQKPRPSTTLDSTLESTPVTRNEVCMKPGCSTVYAERGGRHGRS